MDVRRFTPPSRPVLLAILMGVSAVAVLLPKDFLRPAGKMTQLIALPQWATRRAVQGVAGPLGPAGQVTVTGAQHQSLLIEKQALERENAALRQINAELRSRAEMLAHLRQQGLPDQAVLIPAQVIGVDAVPGRDSLLLKPSRSHRVNPRDWVASRLFVHAGRNEHIREASRVLAGEYLVGWVEQAGAWTSRVVLLSDVLASRGTRVHVVPADPGRPGPRLDGRAVAFVLVGQGQGRMRVLDIAAGFVDSGQVAVGDWVTSSADDPKLCVPLVIGRITALRHNRQKPLYYDAVVCFPQDPKSLREVFVVGMTRTDS